MGSTSALCPWSSLSSLLVTSCPVLLFLRVHLLLSHCCDSHVSSCEMSCGDPKASSSRWVTETEMSARANLLSMYHAQHMRWTCLLSKWNVFCLDGKILWVRGGWIPLVPFWLCKGLGKLILMSCRFPLGRDTLLSSLVTRYMCPAVWTVIVTKSNGM